MRSLLDMEAGVKSQNKAFVSEPFSLMVLAAFHTTSSIRILNLFSVLAPATKAERRIKNSLFLFIYLFIFNLTPHVHS